MDSLSSWLASVSWPIVSRVLVSLGIGTVTYTGASTMAQSAIDAAKGAFMGLAGEAVQLLAMAGVFDFLSITSGGILSGIAWMTLKKFALQTTAS
jgi:hypothetical protein